MSADKKLTDDTVDPASDTASEEVVTVIADASDGPGDISRGADAKIALSLDLSGRRVALACQVIGVIDPSMAMTESELASERDAIAKRFQPPSGNVSHHLLFFSLAR